MGFRSGSSRQALSVLNVGVVLLVAGAVAVVFGYIPADIGRFVWTAWGGLVEHLEFYGAPIHRFTEM